MRRFTIPRHILHWDKSEDIVLLKEKILADNLLFLFEYSGWYVYQYKNYTGPSAPNIASAASEFIKEFIDNIK